MNSSAAASFVTASANSGTQPESVSFTASTNGTVVQIEVRAVVNSIFQITAAQTAASPQADAPRSSLAPALVGPITPLVTARPARQAAIESGQTVNVPLISR